MTTLEALTRAGANAVAYSDGAWAAARKSSAGGSEGMWFPDHGSHSSRSLTSQQMADWSDDWEILLDPTTKDTK